MAEVTRRRKGECIRTLLGVLARLYATVRRKYSIRDPWERLIPNLAASCAMIDT
jgi:hypothetical protein